VGAVSAAAVLMRRLRLRLRLHLSCSLLRLAKDVLQQQLQLSPYRLLVRLGEARKCK
jgi:hypothetical protein